MLRKVGGLASPERWTAGQGAGCHLPSVCVFFGTWDSRTKSKLARKVLQIFGVSHVYVLSSPACRSLRHAVGDGIFEAFSSPSKQLHCK